jgi:hypothetical protein
MRRWWGRYDPNDDRAVGYWPLLRRPGVPNAPETRRPVWTTILYGVAVLALVVLVVSLVAVLMSS